MAGQSVRRQRAIIIFENRGNAGIILRRAANCHPTTTTTTAATTHLERGVDEPQIGVVLKAGVHPRADEPLHRALDCAPVDTPRQPEVLVERVAVAVLLGDPRARPAAPGRGVAAGLVAHAVERVDHRHVGRQRLLGDHVADQSDVVGVGELAGALAQLADLLEEVGRGRVGEEVLRLPALLDGLEDREHALGGKGVKRANELKALRADGVDLAHRDEDDG